MDEGITWRTQTDHDLPAILDFLGLAYSDAEWAPSHVEAAGDMGSANRLMDAAEAGETLSGHELRALTVDVQVIDGDFTARAGGDVIALIRAVRGDWWDLYTRDATLLATALRTFPGATPIPS